MSKTKKCSMCGSTYEKSLFIVSGHTHENLFKMQQDGVTAEQASQQLDGLALPIWHCNNKDCLYYEWRWEPAEVSQQSDYKGGQAWLSE